MKPFLKIIQHAAVTALVALQAVAVQAEAVALQLNSGKKRVKMIEMLTSEGCSSCPPADRLLSSFKKSPHLWKSVVPVAFHVDYWNWIGWDDPFSSTENSKRQYRHKDVGNVGSVYTPGFVINGDEWRGYFNGGHWRDRNPNDIGNLSFELKGDQVKAAFAPAVSLPVKNWKLHVALLGMDISQKIDRGENRNKTLEHDFVLLQEWEATASEPNWTTRLRKFSLDTYRRQGVKEFAVAVWVSGDRSPTPLQSTGGFLAAR